MKKRGGFGIIDALFVIVLVGGLISLALRYAKVSIHRTATSYEKEAAELFLNSAVELTMLAIQGYDRASNGNCLNHVHIISRDSRFSADINITRYFLLNGSNDCSRCGNLCEPVQTGDSQGYVMLELEVDSNNSHPKNEKNLRILIRTLQRP